MSRSAYTCALELLARREHSQKQLTEKLRQKGFTDLEEIRQVLETLVSQGYQSDQRFAEAYMRSRIQKGFGLRRVIVELQQKGIVDDELLDALAQSMAEPSLSTESMIYRAWLKKFGSIPSNPQEKHKQTRYLIYRGFGSDHIKQLFHLINSNSEFLS